MRLNFYFVVNTLCYLFLYLSVIALWIPKFKKIPLWILALTLSILFGLLSHRLEPITLIFILLLGGVTWCLSATKTPLFLRIASGVLLCFLGVEFGMFLLPGFHNQSVLNQVYMSSGAIPFNLYLNIDKTILGILIIGLLHERLKTKKTMA